MIGIGMWNRRRRKWKRRMDMDDVNGYGGCYIIVIGVLLFDHLYSHIFYPPCSSNHRHLFVFRSSTLSTRLRSTYTAHYISDNYNSSTLSNNGKRSITADTILLSHHHTSLSCPPFLSKSDTVTTLWHQTQVATLRS